MKKVLLMCCCLLMVTTTTQAFLGGSYVTSRATEFVSSAVQDAVQDKSDALAGAMVVKGIRYLIRTYRLPLAVGSVCLVCGLYWYTHRSAVEENDGPGGVYPPVDTAYAKI